VQKAFERTEPEADSLVFYAPLLVAGRYKDGIRQHWIWTFINLLPLRYRQQTYETSECFQ